MAKSVGHASMIADSGLAPAGTLVSPPPAAGEAPVASLPAAATSSATPANATNRVIKRRAPVACRRCRRMRSKCIHNGAKPPCEGCRAAGVGLDECVFPARGVPDLDREYRHPRMRGDKARKETAKVHQHNRPSTAAGDADGTELDSAGLRLPNAAASLPANLWDLLPPLEQVIDGVNMFTEQYFQLGFIPRHMFVRQLRDNPRSVSPFLLLSVLSVSARLTPSLVATYGDAVKTAELFMDYASAVALTELYNEPTLYRCQAFYLLSIAQQGNGYKNKSFVNLGIAIRMAILMQLHREETYLLQDPTPNIVREAESARRTLWMLYSQDNLHAGPLAPVSLAASDITTLLPSNEEDFANGVLPKTRAALEDTPPAIEDPQLVAAPQRSLFATLIQSHQLWGTISRRAVRNNKSTDPWDGSSEYAKIQRKLSDWEANLPQEHLWSPLLLKKSKAEGYDLSYLIVTMVTRLCNIIIRKAYIANMLRQGRNKPPQGFWKVMAEELFSNVKDLYVQIDIWFKEREPGDSTGAQMGIFCVYSCGLMAAYLCKYPNLCHDSSISHEAPHMLERTLDILAQSKSVWPLANRWLDSLEQFAAADQRSTSVATNEHEGSMAEGKDPIPSALHPPLVCPVQTSQAKTRPDSKQHVARQLGTDSPHTRSASPSSNQGNGAYTQRQIQASESFLNATARLPPPLPSPGSVTSATPAASHFSPALQQPLQQHQHRQHNLDIMQLHHPPLSHPPRLQPYPQPLSQQQPMQPMMSIAPQTSTDMTGAALSQPQPPPPPPLPQEQSHHGIVGPPSMAGASPAQPLPPSHNNLDLLVQAFDSHAQSSTDLPLPPEGVNYRQAQQPPSQPPMQPQQAPNPQAMLPSHSAGAVVGGAVSMPAEFYDAPFHMPTNDGYEHELEFLLEGPGVVPGTVWGSGMFGY